MKRKASCWTLVILVLFFAPRIGTYIADQLNPFFASIDPDKKFTWSILHHIVQALIPVLVVLVWKKSYFREWGLQPGNVKSGMKWVGWFTLIWTLVYAGLTLFHHFTDSMPVAYYDVINTRNLLGELFFRGFIVGPSEELLFRSFPIVLLLAAGHQKKTDLFGFEITQAGIIAAVLFALAHIGFNLYPFEVYHFNVVQIVTALGFGLLYAVVFRHTQSIFYPMVLHAVSDLIPVLSLYCLHIMR